ncbi:MAG TPA: cobalamin B12-binding domain-containing protein [Acidisphaera sp.]|nr:cobalamin B12-binding domain-containing protein [Acidisphaera sp.]
MDAFVRRRMHERPLPAEFGLAPSLAHGGGSSRPDADTVVGILSRTVERHVVPQLVLSHRVPVVRRKAAAVPTQAEIRAFTALSLDEDGQALLAYIDALRARGVTLETVFLQLLTPAANLLGDMWTDDERDFAEITIASWRLQQAMVALTEDFIAEGNQASNGGVMLIAPCPGEQHVFGAMMASRFFQREGWNVYAEFESSCDGLACQCKRMWFDAVAFSLHQNGHADMLAEAVRQVRAASCNPTLHVMLGGWAFHSSPELAARVGGDYVAHDIKNATQHLTALLAERALQG